MLGVQEAPAEGNAGALNINSQRNIMSKRGTLSLNGKKKKKKVQETMQVTLFLQMMLVRLLKEQYV